MRVTKPPFDINQSHVQQPRCENRVSLEDKQRFFAQRAAETEQRHALFDAAALLQQQYFMNSFHHGDTRLVPGSTRHLIVSRDRKNTLFDLKLVSYS